MEQISDAYIFGLCAGLIAFLVVPLAVVDGADDPATRFIAKWHRELAHYRKRAAECIELADSSFAGIEAHYRSLAGRYIKLAEAEEDFAARRGGQDRLSPSGAAG